MTDLQHKRARELRKNSTKAESVLWQALRNRRLKGLKFRRQHPIGHYIVDFCCPEKKVIIELDGGYHLYTYEKDQKRQRELESLGYRVLRFWNEDILEDLGAIVQYLELLI